jgi:hypothetical protein
MRNVSNTCCKENQNIPFSNFCRNRAVYETSKHFLEPKRPQMTIWRRVARWIRKATRDQAHARTRAPTHTHANALTHAHALISFLHHTVMSHSTKRNARAFSSKVCYHIQLQDPKTVMLVFLPIHAFARPSCQYYQWQGINNYKVEQNRMVWRDIMIHKTVFLVRYTYGQQNVTTFD